MPPAEVCNGADDDCDGATDDVGGGFACGDDCCAGAESRCDCPADCGVPVLPAPGPLSPSNGRLTGSLHAPASSQALRPLFRWSLSCPGPCGPPLREIQVDDSCTTPGFASCTFPSPEASAADLTADEWRPASDLPVAEAAPVGRRYYWRARACDAGGRCSPWSPVRYVDVGRLPCDLNGDGYSDLAVGAPDQSFGLAGAGALYVLPGSSTGLPATIGGFLPSPRPDLGGAFANSVACGDLDADGFADLVVGGIDQTSGATYEGNAYFLLGGATGVGATPAVRLDSPANQELAVFSFNIVVPGDVNGDGYADAAIAATREHAEDYEAGAVHVYHGSSSGLPAVPNTSVACFGSCHRAEFGAGLATAGDVDLDGYADLLVGAPGFDGGATDEGGAFVFRGGPDGLSRTAAWSVECPGHQADAAFGTTVAAGDVDGDGWTDLLVGATGYDGSAPDEGRAWVYLGGASGFPASPSVPLACPDGGPRSVPGWPPWTATAIPSTTCSSAPSSTTTRPRTAAPYS